MYTDQTLICKDCGRQFVFSAGEQKFFADRALNSKPQRCKECRVARKNSSATHSKSDTLSESDRAYLRKCQEELKDIEIQLTYAAGDYRRDLLDTRKLLKGIIYSLKNNLPMPLF